MPGLQAGQCFAEVSFWSKLLGVVDGTVTVFSDLKGINQCAERCMEGGGEH